MDPTQLVNVRRRDPIKTIGLQTLVNVCFQEKKMCISGSPKLLELSRNQNDGVFWEGEAKLK